MNCEPYDFFLRSFTQESIFEFNLERTRISAYFGICLPEGKNIFDTITSANINGDYTIKIEIDDDDDREEMHKKSCNFILTTFRPYDQYPDHTLNIEFKYKDEIKKKVSLKTADASHQIWEDE
jgi:hypothetical protein